MGRIMITVGILLVLLGLVWLYFPRALSWFGHLPGDMRIEREDFSLFIPVTSMLLTSVLLTLLINGVIRVLHLLDR
jgi:hypothetical protein